MSRKGTIQPPANTITPKTSTPSSPFYGRGDQCDMIIKLLLDESHADLNSKTKTVPIIAIRGLGGAGKTTTAQHVYNENKIDNYFDLMMWVHVTRGFDERGLIKEVIESAKKNACDQISNLDVLQAKLKDSVSKNKFLLVLDDVWEGDTGRLDILLSPLNQVGVKGSRIIVTTRTEKAAKDLNAKPIIPLDELKDEDCWSILKHYAFDDNEVVLDVYQKYVGNQIISKVKHSPLALKVVGSSLRNKRSANEWDKILQQDILKETMDLLLFSYQCLPLHLQRCFAYCSLFPKGYTFSIDVHYRLEPDMISLWIAQGFIENTSELTLEETGKKYIEELLSYSFFENYFENYFVIHDLLHELAEKVSKKQCHRIEHYDSLSHVPTTCIHLSLCITESLVSIYHSAILATSNIFNLRNLRSLIILGYGGSTNIFKSKKDIFQNLTKLRALYVGYQQMVTLSDPCIDNLKHLRYLYVRYDSKLPTSLTKLYQLQFFILIIHLQGDSGNLLANTLPQGFGNLSNLRILKFYEMLNIGFERELDYLHYNSEMINIEKLTSLQNLKKFYVDRFNGIISLKNLPLGGSLSILNLENVKCKKEAEAAMLNKKKNLKELTFIWSSTPSSIDTCREVLEGLEPYRNLEKLEINGYQGVKLPKWMVKENLLPRLQYLTLITCKSLKIVPFLPPRLKELHVRDCDKLMQLPPFGDTLYCLNLYGCSKLTSLENLQRCTSLKQLYIYKCPMLRREEASLAEGVVEGDIANRLPHVETISMDDPLLVLELVQQQAFGSVKRLRLDGCGALPNLEKFSSLHHLIIAGCPTIESLPNLKKYEEGGPFHPDLKGCGTLSNLEKFSSLHELSIVACPTIESLPNLPVSLKSLLIEGCPAIESLPNLPVSLQNLYVYECPKLKEKYEEGGPLRNTISHIRLILFY